MRTGSVSCLAVAAAVACLLAPATAARAAVTGSLHDFSATGPYGQKSIDTGGVCTPCHSAHFTPYLPAGWPRSMTNEVTFYEQNGSVGANYLPGAALLCFDCHDDNVSADSDPANAVFSNPPQDIARGGAGVGYYENACGLPPVGVNPAPTDGSPTGGHYWKSEPSLSPDYKRGDKIACSLCHNPHKVATGSNEAFFRTTTWDGAAIKPLNDFNSYGTDLNASTYNATTLPNGSRNGTGTGREMCAICHGYSDQGNQATLYNVTVPKPPGLQPGDVLPVPEHTFADTTPCISCHGHNQIAGCNECHGYPPLLTELEGGGVFDRTHATRQYVENYPGGAGAHRRHLEALGSAIFECELCHGPNPGRPGTTWHNESTGATCNTVTPANVDIMGLTSYWGAGSSYNGVSAGGFTDPGSGAIFAFKARGGANGTGDGRCAALTCHGNPPASTGGVYLNWTDKMVDQVSGDIVGDGLSICKWCHDRTPAKIGTGPAAPNVLGADDGATGVWTTGTWGADVSGHGKAAGNYDGNALNDAGGKSAANKSCTVCHDARYTSNPLPAMNTPVKTHFDNAYESSGSEKRLRGTINGLPVATTDAACGTCHQNGVTGDGAEVSMHGNSTAGGYAPPLEDQFTRSCRQCHDVHGANWNGTTRNLHMIGTWLDSTTVGTRGIAEAGEESRVDSIATTAAKNITAADHKVIFTNNSGAGSYDAGNNEGYNPPKSVCVVCHVALVNNHSQVGDDVPRGSASGHNVGLDCMQCHDHDFENAVATGDAFMPSGCNGCHGNSTTNRYWPDGLDNNGTSRVVYADDNAGAHDTHVAAISMRVFGLDAAGLLIDADTYTKQRQICLFCHANPGGGNHNLDNTGLAGRVDVYPATGVGAYFGRFGVGAEPLPPAVPVEDTTGTAYVPGAVNQGTCGNLVCHNQTTTPFWNAPPVWVASILPNATCSNLACHAATTYTIAHNTHVNGAPKSFACTECHADNYTVVPATNPIPLAHGNGEVDMKWDNAGSLEAAHGGNGFYDKDSNGAAAPATGDTGFEYKSGNVLPADPTKYARSCYLVYCHGGDNDNNVLTSIPDWGGSTTSPSSVWNYNRVALGRLLCTTCHAAAPPTGRHTVHDTNNAWVPNECGSCHLANNDKTTSMDAFATHVNGSVDFQDGPPPPTAPPAVVYTPATGTCTNACHLVGVAVPPVSADPGDWLDANPLACPDCHSATYIGTAPASGLHDATTAMAHDDQFLATAAQPPLGTATCRSCHQASPSTSHLTGSAGLAPPTQNSTETTYNFVAANVVSYSQAAGCQAICHSDNQVLDTVPAGLPASPWRRRWIGAVDAKPLAANNPGDGVCWNCHGDFTNGWRTNAADQTTTGHTNPFNQGGLDPDRMDQHSVCKTCHGWGNANYSGIWGDVTLPSHGDGSISMNGPSPTTGAQYINAGVNAGGCAKACHVPSYVMNSNSGWPVNYGDYGSGACELCHNGSTPNPGCDGVLNTPDDAPNVMGPGTSITGTGGTPRPYDDGIWGYNVNGHGANGTAVNRPTPALNPARPCTDCHDISLPSPSKHFDCDPIETVDQRVNTRWYFGKSADTRNANTSHLVAGYLAGANNPQAKQLGFDDYCYNTCHATDPGPVIDMRHGTKVANVYDEIMQFNTAYDTTDDPKQNRGADNVWTPWTIDDLTNIAGVDANPPGVRHHGVCVSCHDPHGTSATDKTRLTNKMVIRNWKGVNMQPWCGSNCHKIP